MLLQSAILILVCLVRFARLQDLTWGATIGGSNAAPQTSNPGVRVHAAMTSVQWPNGDVSVFLFGGFVLNSIWYLPNNDLYRYDVRSSAWTRLTLDIMTPRPSARVKSSLVYDGRNNSIYVIGGGYTTQVQNFCSSSTGTCSTSSFTFTDEVWRYDLTSNAWSKIESESTPGNIEGFTSCFNPSERSFYMFGGVSKIGSTVTFSSRLWKYDLAGNNWSALSSTNVNGPSARNANSLSCDFLTETIYVYGGCSSTACLEPLSDLWRFNLSTNIWSPIASPSNGPSSRRHHITLNAPGGGFYLFYGGVSSTYDNLFWRFDPRYSTWTNRTVDNSWLNELRNQTASTALSLSSSFTTYFIYGGYKMSSASRSFNGDLLTLNATVLSASTTTTSIQSTTTVSVFAPTAAIQPQTTIVTANGDPIIVINGNGNGNGTSGSPEDKVSSLYSSSSKQITSSLKVTSTFKTTIFQSTATNVAPTDAEAASMLLSYLPIIGGAAGGMVLIVIVVLAVTTFRRRRIRQYSKGSGRSTDVMVRRTGERANTTIMTSNATSMNTTQLMMTQTKVSTQRELTVPAFLEYEDGKDFVKVKQLAKGGGGSVHVGTAYHEELLIKSLRKSIIVKVVDVPERATAEEVQELRKSFQQEIALMWFFRDNKFFAKLFGFNYKKWIILMKFYEFGSLEKYIHEPAKCQLAQRAPLTVTTVRALATDIASALFAMHDNGFVHCDVKCANILVDWDSEENRVIALLTDFGITRVVSDQSLLVRAFRVNEVEGASYLYAAPEVLQRILSSDQGPVTRSEQIMKAGDTYAYAIVLYELLTQAAPWQGVSSIEKLTQLVMAGMRPNIKPDFLVFIRQQKPLVAVYESMLQCWSNNPMDRPSLGLIAGQLRSQI